MCLIFYGPIVYRLGHILLKDGSGGSIPRRVTTSLLKDKSFAVQAWDGKLANKKY